MQSSTCSHLPVVSSKISSPATASCASSVIELKSYSIIDTILIERARTVRPCALAAACAKDPPRSLQID